MVMVAPASARNHANVGPAMPAPLIKTRIASFDVFESVRTLEGRMNSELEARTGLVILQLLDKEDHLQQQHSVPTTAAWHFWGRCSKRKCYQV